LFSIKKLEDFVPAGHPLQAMRAMVNDSLSRQRVGWATRRRCVSLPCPAEDLSAWAQGSLQTGVESGWV